MKRLMAILFTATLTGFGPMNATAANITAVSASQYTDSFIFMEGGITFSVFPNGEFDFYIDNNPAISANVNMGNVNIGFNSGYDYNAYVQYDDYGAVVQVLHTPVFYDYYGRVSRIGSINIHYNAGRVMQVGGLHVYYDAFGGFNRFTGYINVYNRRYIHRPFHRFFMRPLPRYCIVDYRPYRRHYHPVRYTYHRPYRNNTRRAYASVGKTYHYKDNRRSVYMNDRRVKSRNYTTQRREIAQRSSANNNSSRRAVATQRENNNRDSQARRGNNTANSRNSLQNSSSRSNKNANTPTNVRRNQSGVTGNNRTPANRRDTYNQPSSRNRETNATRNTAPRVNNQARNVQRKQSTAPRVNNQARNVQRKQSTAPRVQNRNTRPNTQARKSAPQRQVKSAGQVRSKGNTTGRTSSNRTRGRG